MKNTGYISLDIQTDIALWWLYTANEQQEMNRIIQQPDSVWENQKNKSGLSKIEDKYIEKP